MTGTKIPNLVDQNIAVWFSCGAASAVAAAFTVKLFGEKNHIRILNNPVAEEDEDNRRFLVDVENWIGRKVETVTNPDFPSGSAVDVWDREKAMSFPNGAPCTRLLKRRARELWEDANHTDWHVLGFTADERLRYERFIKTERPNVLHVLHYARATKQDCFRALLAAGIELPRSYRLGFNNANCIGCCKMTSPTGWNLTRKHYPDVFDQRAEQSRRLGVRLVRYKGDRIFLDQLPEHAKGGSMKEMQVECGLFCEEYKI